MNFRYLKDPLFLVCLLLYSTNRWVLKPYLPNEFSISYLNDVICIPFWVPIMLYFMRKVGLRNDDERPRATEILIPLCLWSWLFEDYLPFTEFFKPLATSDYLDVLCYTLGALLAAIAWKIWYRKVEPIRSPQSVCIPGR